MDHLYVTGGRQRQKLITKEEEWNLYERALILKVCPADGTASICVEYQSPREACPSEGTPSILFKAGMIVENKLYVCTGTEVLIYEIPGFRQIGYVSLPCFNDLHHVAREADGNLLVVSTGLDMVVEITPTGKVLRQWNVLGEDPWERFLKNIDYRKVATTKPHRSHPNYVFQIGADIWVTRCDQSDAVCLTQPGRRIPLASVCVHDGHLHKGKLYFTTVDGTIVVADAATRQILKVIDLKQIDNSERALLGWCRGLLIVDERRIWVGFTRVRKTKFREKISWVKHVFHDTQKPTHISLYDIHSKKCLREIDVEKYGLNILFSIFPAERPCSSGNRF
ncbi:MAG: hypothetical protein WAN10_11090 [Candidatus Acidiferrales bacterium]